MLAHAMLSVGHDIKFPLTKFLLFIRTSSAQSCLASHHFLPQLLVSLPKGLLTALWPYFALTHCISVKTCQACWEPCNDFAQISEPMWSIAIAACPARPA